MENVGFAALQIIPSMKGFESKLTSGTSGPLSAAGSKGGRLFGNSAGRSIASSVASHAKKAAFLGAAAFAAVGAAAFKLGKDSIAEARESQKVGALTTSVIKATGGAANVTAKQVGDLAGALSLKTGIDDEVIQSGQNMLLTFKNVRNEVGKGNDIFDQSTKTLIDMSSAMGTEPKQAAIQLGKALNDPIKGITALSRVGVTFTDQQKEQIKTLVESGDTMKAQKIILAELKSEFGGAAAAQATMGEKVKTAWGNVEEQLGTALLPLLDKVERAFLKKGVPALQGWIDVFTKKGVPALKHFGKWVTTDGVDKLEDFYHSAKPVAEDVLPAIFDLLKAGKPILKVSAGLVGNLASAFTKIPHWAQVAIAGGLLAGKAGGFKLAGGLLAGSKGGLLGGISKAAPLPVLVTNPGFGVNGKGSGKNTPYVADGNEDRKRRRRRGAATGTALVAGVIGDELTGGKISEILAHPLRELKAEALYPFQGPKYSPPGKVPSRSSLAKPELLPNLTGPGGYVADLNVAGKAVEGLDAKAAAFRDTLFLTGNTKVDPKFGTPGLPQAQKAVQDFIAAKVEAGKPFTLQVGTGNVERAISQVRTLNAELRAAADVARGLDNGVTYQHGGQSGSSVDGRITAHHGDRGGV